MCKKVKVDLDNCQLVDKLRTRGGIYGILCVPTNKWYIGRTIYQENENGKRYRNLAVRLLESRTYLRKQKYHNRYVQRAWNKYGEGQFEFYVIAAVKENDGLPELEAHYMEVFNSLDPKYGFNLLAADVTLGGWKHSPDTITKLTEIAKVRAKELQVIPEELEEEIVELYRTTNKSKKDIGKIFGCSSGPIVRILRKYLTKTELRNLSLKKLSEAHKGYVMPIEQRKKIGEASKGHEVTDDARRKISKAVTKHTLTIDGITKNLSEWSEDTGLKYGTILRRCKNGVADCLEDIGFDTLTVDGITRTFSEWSQVSGIGISTLRYRKNKGLSDKECVSKEVGSDFKTFDEILQLLFQSNLPEKGSPEYNYFVKYRMKYRQGKLSKHEVQQLESIEWWSWTHGTKTLKAVDRFGSEANLNGWSVVKRGESLRDKWEMQCPMKHLVFARPTNLIRSWQDGRKFGGCGVCKSEKICVEV